MTQRYFRHKSKCAGGNEVRKYAAEARLSASRKVIRGFLSFQVQKWQIASDDKLIAQKLRSLGIRSISF